MTASISCLRHISERRGARESCTRLGDQTFWIPSTDLFSDCKIAKCAQNQCLKKPQELTQRKPAAKDRPFPPLGGAVVFGNCPNKLLPQPFFSSKKEAPVVHTDSIPLVTQPSGSSSHSQQSARSGDADAVLNRQQSGRSDDPNPFLNRQKSGRSDDANAVLNRQQNGSSSRPNSASQSTQNRNNSPARTASNSQRSHTGTNANTPSSSQQHRRNDRAQGAPNAPESGSRHRIEDDSHPRSGDRKGANQRIRGVCCGGVDVK